MFVTEDLQPAFRADDSSKSHPLSQSVDTPPNTYISSIIYAKVLHLAQSENLCQTQQS